MKIIVAASFSLFLSAAAGLAGAPGPLQVWYQDLDGDGLGNNLVAMSAETRPHGYVANNDDCDDTRRNIEGGCAAILQGSSGIDPVLPGLLALVVLGAALGGGGSTSGTN